MSWFGNLYCKFLPILGLFKAYDSYLYIYIYIYMMPPPMDIYIYIYRSIHIGGIVQMKPKNMGERPLTPTCCRVDLGEGGRDVGRWSWWPPAVPAFDNSPSYACTQHKLRLLHTFGTGGNGTGYRMMTWDFLRPQKNNTDFSTFHQFSARNTSFHLIPFWFLFSKSIGVALRGFESHPHRQMGVAACM